MGDRVVSDPWIHVFDGTAVSVDELEELRLLLTAAADAARDAAASVTYALGIVSALGWWAPLHAGQAVWELGQAMDSVVGMGREIELLAADMAAARDVYVEAQYTVTQVMALYRLQQTLMPVPESLSGLVAAAGVVHGAVAVGMSDAPPVVAVQRELRVAASLVAQATPKVRGQNPATPVSQAAAGVLAATGQHTVRGAVVLEEVRMLTKSGLDSALAVLDQLQAAAEESDSLGVGEIRVVEQINAAGQRAFTVVLPGTREMWNDSNPQDHLSNVQLMAGLTSDLMVAVHKALELAGIAPEDPVVLVGHSQGGIVAAQLAADAEFVRRYNVQGVLTLGSPVGQVRLPQHIASLHLENMQDAVPALDGVANTADVQHVTVVRAGGSHAVQDYGITLTAAVGASRSVRQVEQRLATSAGWRSGSRATVRSYRFEREPQH